MDGFLAEEIVTINPTQQHTATVIFLHGAGQSNLTWHLVLAQAFAPRLPHVRWILPQARLVTFNRNQRSTSWFGRSLYTPCAAHPTYDESGMSESVRRVEDLILSQVHLGIDSNNIIIMGFDQGASLGLAVALTSLHELGGVVCMSGRLPDYPRNHMIYASPRLPILWCHGEADLDIPISCARSGLHFLSSVLRFPPTSLTFQSFPGLNHGINDAELDCIVFWLLNIR